MPATGPTPPSYPSERADVWRAIEGLERRLAAPTAEPQAKTGTVTSMRPTVRVLGTEEDRLVWRVNTGTELHVDDEVLCVETALGLVVLSVVVQPPLGPGKPPSGPGPNLIPDPNPVWAGYSGSGYFASRDFDPACDWRFTVSPEPPGYNLSYYYYESLAPLGVLPASAAYADWSASWPLPSGSYECRWYPVAAGIGPVAVTPDVGYVTSVHVRSQGYSGFSQQVRMGVRWYDAAGALVSESVGSSGPFTPQEWVDGDGDSWGNGPSAHPEAVLTAPPGAAYARPFVSWLSTDDFYMCWATHFWFGRA